MRLIQKPINVLHRVIYIFLLVLSLSVPCHSYAVTNDEASLKTEVSELISHISSAVISKDGVTNRTEGTRLFEIGIVYLKEGAYEAAIKHFTELLDLIDDDFVKRDRSAIYAAIGIANQSLDKYAEAATAYALSLNQENVNPDDQWIKEHRFYIYIQRGNTYNILGKLGAAIDDFNSVLKHIQNEQFTKVNFSSIYVNRGISYAALGMYDEAMNDLYDALKQEDRWLKDNRNKVIEMQHLVLNLKTNLVVQELQRRTNEEYNTETVEVPITRDTKTAGDLIIFLPSDFPLGGGGGGCVGQSCKKCKEIQCNLDSECESRRRMCLLTCRCP